MAKKAAIITDYDPYKFRGGIETYTLHLLSFLRSRGIEVVLYHTGLARDKSDAADINLKNKFIKEVFHIGRRLLAEQSRYDFIIANSFYGMGYFPPSVKTFTVYHSLYGGFIEKYKDIYSYDPGFYFQFICEEMGEYVSGYNRIKIAVSEEIKSELELIYGFRDVTVIHHGIDTALFKKNENRQHLRQNLGIPEEAFIGLFVGRWENLKKGYTLMNALISECPDVYWLLVLGTGGEECELGNTPRVMIKRGIPYEDMPVMYSVSDFMVFPSHYEGFGFAIIEAMSCGLPVITTNVGIAVSIYKGRPFNALLLATPYEGSQKDVMQVIERIALLRDEPKLRKEITECGIALVREKFSLERWEKDMEAVLKG